MTTIVRGGIRACGRCLRGQMVRDHARGSIHLGDDLTRIGGDLLLQIQHPVARADEGLGEIDGIGDDPDMGQNISVSDEVLGQRCRVAARHASAGTSAAKSSPTSGHSATMSRFPSAAATRACPASRVTETQSNRYRVCDGVQMSANPPSVTGIAISGIFSSIVRCIIAHHCNGV